MTLPKAPFFLSLFPWLQSSFECCDYTYFYMAFQMNALDFNIFCDVNSFMNFFLVGKMVYKYTKQTNKQSMIFINNWPPGLHLKCFNPLWGLQQMASSSCMHESNIFLAAKYFPLLLLKQSELDSSTEQAGPTNDSALGVVSGLSVATNWLLVYVNQTLFSSSQEKSFLLFAVLGTDVKSRISKYPQKQVTGTWLGFKTLSVRFGYL